MIRLDSIVGSALKSQNEAPMSLAEAWSEVRLSPLMLSLSAALGLILSLAIAWR